MSFDERYEQMGLSVLGPGCYHYSDIHSQILYRNIQTTIGSEILDGFEIPNMAIFTRKTENDDYLYKGLVSDSYKFMGNEALVQQLRNSINEIGTPILTEIPQLNYDLTMFHNQIVISNPKSIPEQGNIYPEIVIKNTYNGTGAANIAFGLYMSGFGFRDKTFGFSFRDKLSTMRQIHLADSQTSLSSIGGYMSTFSENISELIRQNFEMNVTEEELLSTLDLVEKVGKNRRKEISSLIEELTTDNNQNITTWKLFLAITRFSSIESNLNAKMLLENIAERILIVPERMINAMEQINRRDTNSNRDT